MAGAGGAHGAPGDIAVADEGNWFGSSGARAARPDAAAPPRCWPAGAPLSDPWAVAVAADGALLRGRRGRGGRVLDLALRAPRTVVSGAGLQDPVGHRAGAGRQGLRLRPAARRGAAARPRERRALTHVADLENATGLAMDEAGKLLVTDGVAVRRIDPGTGAVTTVAAGAPLDDPRDVAVGLDGTLYVAGDRQVVRVNPATGAKSVLAGGPPLNDPRAIDIEPDGDLVVADGRHAGGAVIHVDRETGAKSSWPAAAMFRVPAGLGVVGGAGVDPSGGGNGDPDGPAAPPIPSSPAPAGAGAGGTRGPPDARRRRPRGGGITVTLPDGSVVTLPPGVTPATSGIRGIDFVAPRVPRASRKLSATRFRAARRGRAFVSASASARAIQWLLNEPARVTITVQKFRHLSRVCRRKARRSRHRTGTRCRKWITVKGRYSKASLAGASSVRFRGRLRGRALKPGPTASSSAPATARAT